MNTHPKLELIYLNVRALAEAPQMIMHYANIPFSYKMAWDYYGEPWLNQKKNAPFNQLPILIINDKIQIWQSGAIVRYVANIANITPKDPILLAYADAIFESTQELQSPLNPTINLYTKEKFNEFRNKLINIILPKKFYNFDRQLKKISGNFFLGNEPYYCDFAAYHYFEMALLLDKNIFDDYPRIKNHMYALINLNGIKKYLNSRPKIIDIGINPKMKINDTEIRTGSNPFKKN
jgi:glutathione S-transferase